MEMSKTQERKSRQDEIWIPFKIACFQIIMKSSFKFKNNLQNEIGSQMHFSQLFLVFRHQPTHPQPDDTASMMQWQLPQLHRDPGSFSHLKVDLKPMKLAVFNPAAAPNSGFKQHQFIQDASPTSLGEFRGAWGFATFRKPTAWPRGKP